MLCNDHAMIHGVLRCWGVRGADRPVEVLEYRAPIHTVVICLFKCGPRSFVLAVIKMRGHLRLHGGSTASVEVANLSTLAARPTGVRFSWRPRLIINPKPQDRRRRAAGAKPRWPRRPGFRVDGLLLQADQFGFPILGLGSTCNPN